MSVEPTLDPAAASRRLWDAVVVGAGPAGAMAARELARRGAGVLLVDKARFPRYKVCGGCLNPRALRVLDRAGLGHLVEKLRAVPLTRFKLGARGAVADVPLPPGAGLSREALDTALVREAVLAGAAFLPGVGASLLPVGPAERPPPAAAPPGRPRAIDRRADRAGGERAYRRSGGARRRPRPTPTALGAGLAGRGRGHDPRAGPGLRAGHDLHGVRRGRVCRPDGRRGRAGGHGRRPRPGGGQAGRRDRGVGRRDSCTGRLRRRILDWLALPWKGTPHLTRQAPALGGERLFVLGDAAGYIEPFTGEGMAWAFAGAALVAPLALRGARLWDPELLVRWRGAYHRKVTRRQIICRITADLLRRPAATRVTVGALSIAPWLARPLFRIMYRD